MGWLDRTAFLVGSEGIEQLKDCKVVLFGVGGVGSWCAEGLIRSGVGHLTIVDFDRVSESNINRQLPALHSTIGRLKVEVLRERLLDINPEAEVTALGMHYTSETEFEFGNYDYVVDCIDEMNSKIALLMKASESRATVYSSMGAARKLDPQRIRVAELWKVRGCPLGAAMRKRMSRAKLKPAKPIQCVYSEELKETTDPLVNGTVVYITAVFGMNLAGLVVQNVLTSRATSKREH